MTWSFYRHYKLNMSCFFSRFEYLFNFDNRFEIHDDIEVLKRMGMAFGLEKKTCNDSNIELAKTMVPKALEPYVTGEFLWST